MRDGGEGTTGRRAHARQYLITGSIPVMPFVFWHYLCAVTPWKGAAEKNGFSFYDQNLQKKEELAQDREDPSLELPTSRTK
jgi:hypothetical protein